MVRFLLCKFILASARLIFYRVIAASFRMHVYYRQQKSLRNFRLGGFYVWLCCLTYDARPPCGFFTALVVLLIVIMVTANIFVSLSKGNGAPLPGRPSRNRLGNVQTIHGYLWKVNNLFRWWIFEIILTTQFFQRYRPTNAQYRLESTLPFSS